MKPKVKLIGNSFHPNTSSCSTRIPVNFSWSNDEGDVEVYVDNAILQGASTPNHLKKFGWICESRAVAWQLTEQLKQNHEEILKNYQYIFTCDEELLSLNPKFVFGFAGSTLPWVKLMEYNIYNKTKLCSMIASHKQMCPGHMIRHQVAQKMMETGRVDVMGGAAGSPKFGQELRGQIHPDKLSGLSPYMFSIAMENCQYDTYFTEKLTDCFATGTVPVYWGCPSIGDYFNTDGIIMLTNDFDISTLTADRYYGMMPAIEDNFKRVSKMKSPEDYLWTEYIEKHYNLKAI